MANEKSTMTNIGKIINIGTTYEKLIRREDLSYDEKSLLLSAALIFLDEYNKNTDKSMCFEIAYEIITRYSVFYSDYLPLYDLSINYGLFPITDYIVENLRDNNSILDVINYHRIDEYRSGNFIPTIQQYKAFDGILKDDSDNISFVAPTSFGKSQLILSHIKTNISDYVKVAIIVPTKSLLMQTYQYVRNNFSDKKIILHDQMYENEDSFIAVLTQERALRLLEKSNTYFDYLYIDEAHNLFEKDYRNRLLARLIKLSVTKNPNCNILYFSPLINNSNNLKVLEKTKITEYKINHNIKISVYYLFSENTKQIYNRYFNVYYTLGESYYNAYDYLIKNSTDKSLIYVNSPKRMENITHKIASELPELISPDIALMVNSLKKHVHKDFKMIPYIKRGIVYIHGKLPEYIKDYIEYKVATVSEIKYIVANSVLLEGINLPVSSLFIFDPYGLKSNKLINLCGRVNRLNSIFGENGDIKKLFPEIHFVENGDFSGNMKNYISRLRSNEVIDNVDNPFLNAFDADKLKVDELENYEQLVKQENIYFSDPDSPESSLYKNMIALSFNEHIALSEDTVKEILIRIKLAATNPQFSDKTIVEKVNNIFLNNMEVIDYEIKRLKNIKAINYYNHFLTDMRKNSLQENIQYEFKYFKKRQMSEDHYIFIGSSYGECNSPYSDNKSNMYINLKNKTDSELINIAIIKLKIEDDFLSYKFNKFVELLYEYNLISEDEYNFNVYSTKNEFEIKLVKQGIPIHLVSKLLNEDQLKNLSFDENNIIHCNDKFKSYYKDQDDFYKYQIDKYICI